MYWVFEQYFKPKDKELLKIDFVIEIPDIEKTRKGKLEDKKFDKREKIDNTGTNLKIDYQGEDYNNVSFDYCANNIRSSNLETYLSSIALILKQAFSSKQKYTI